MMARDGTRTASRVQAETYGAAIFRSQKRDLERKVRERTRELERLNEELEAFSASISHDLRAPVAVIRAFGESMLNRGDLPPDAAQRLGRMVAAGEHMTDLIESLLKLAHLGRANLEASRVDVSAMAEEVAAECRDLFSHAVRLHVEAGLEVRADPGLMRVVLSNLLSNAWKFTRGVPTAAVRIGSAAAGAGETAFVVADNGAGFDPAYAHHLFQPFRRLHHASEFPGVGIGLATAHRVMKRHQGHIVAVSSPGAGAAFTLVFPGRCFERL